MYPQTFTDDPETGGMSGFQNNTYHPTVHIPPLAHIAVAHIEFKTLKLAYKTTY